MIFTDLHERMVGGRVISVVPPQSRRRHGAHLRVRHGTACGPFGEVFIAQAQPCLGVGEPGERSWLCCLGFPADEAELALLLREQRSRWSFAHIREDPSLAESLVRRVFSGSWAGSRSPDAGPSLLLTGTDFQLRVWMELLRIPRGELRTYGQIAVAVSGSPAAARAVGRAVGANPISWLVPCHRVVRKSGDLGGYRWGEATKRSAIAWEQGSMGAWPWQR